MDNREMIEHLSGLFRVDNDAVQSYSEAIHRVDTDEVAVLVQLEAFRADHELHMVGLGKIIQGLGGEPPGTGLGVMGFFLKGATAIGSELGAMGALRAAETGEEYTLSEYRDALEYDFPGEIKKYLAACRADEERHLAYLREELEARSHTRTGAESDASCRDNGQAAGGSINSIKEAS